MFRRRSARRGLRTTPVTGSDAPQGFADAGYEVRDLLEAEVVDALRSLTMATLPTEPPPFYAGPAHAWGATAGRFHREAKAVVAPALAAHYPDHEIFLVAATVKGPRGGRVLYHQDWTYTDERVCKPIFLWCPLVDVAAGNGALRVVPGSHLGSAETIRASIGLHGRHATEPFQEAFERASVGLALRAGEVLAFDPATLHGSPDNDTDEYRPAITVALAPRGAPLLHFHREPDGTLSGHLVDEAFFSEHDYATLPVGYPSVEPWTRAIDESDFAARYGEPESTTAAGTRAAP